MVLNYGLYDTVEIHNYDSECDKLHTCPFCGGTPKWHVKGNDSTPSRTVVIKCPDCGVEMKMSGRVFGVQPLAIRIIEKWNTRQNNK